MTRRERIIARWEHCLLWRAHWVGLAKSVEWLPKEGEA